MKDLVKAFYNVCAQNLAREMPSFGLKISNIKIT